MRTHLDLFSGIGGFALAAQRAGFTTVGFCEKEPYAQKILIKNFGAVLADAKRERLSTCPRETNIPKTDRWVEENQQGVEKGIRGQVERCCPIIHPDIFGLDGRAYRGVTLITGGFPCQPFSVAGKRRGASDDRALWPEMFRVISEAKPTWVLGENVAGIVNMELDNVLSDLESIGYSAWPIVIPACAVDAKHRRDRVWIIAHSESTKRELSRDSRPGRNGFTDSRENVAEADFPSGKGNERAERSETERADCQQPHRWPTESGFCRVANGIPNRSHRLKGLGNAIVPQVAEQIIRAMIQTEI